MITELSSICKAIKGDTLAFGEIYDTVKDDLYRYALYQLGNSYDAEDAVQTTALSAFSQIKKLKKPESFRSWIFTILINTCRRKKKDYINAPSSTEEDEIEVKADENITDKVALKMALDTLSFEERNIILLSVISKLKSQEIGDLLGLNDATVRSKKARAYEKLKQLLSEE